MVGIVIAPTVQMRKLRLSVNQEVEELEREPCCQAAVSFLVPVPFQSLSSGQSHCRPRETKESVGSERRQPFSDLRSLHFLGNVQALKQQSPFLSTSQFKHFGTTLPKEKKNPHLMF